MGSGILDSEENMADDEPLFSIGKAAQLVGLNEKTLRFYDDAGIEVAAWRNPENNYRYYSLNQLYRLATKKMAKSLGIALPSYESILLGRGALSPQEYGEAILEIDNVVADHEEKIAALHEQIGRLARIRHDLVALATHEVGGETFRWRFDAMRIAVMLTEDGSPRVTSLPAFYESLSPALNMCESRMGRLLLARDINRGDTRAAGYFCELATTANAEDVASDKIAVYTVPSGSYECFLVREAFTFENWQKAFQFDLTERGVFLAHECGYYKSFEDVIHLVRYLPEGVKNLGNPS